VDLEWTAPDSDGGSRISGYVVVSSTPVAHKTFCFRKFVKGSATNCTLTENLWPGRPYQFAVAARNRAGRGDLSEFSASFSIPTEASATGKHSLRQMCIVCVILYMNILYCCLLDVRY